MLWTTKLKSKMEEQYIAPYFEIIDVELEYCIMAGSGHEPIKQVNELNEQLNKELYKDIENIKKRNKLYGSGYTTNTTNEV